MKVIEGKIGKSIILENIINENKYKLILMIDCVKVPALYKDNIHFYEYNSSKEMWDEFNNDVKFNNFINIIKGSEYDIVIFEMNDVSANIDKYKSIEDKIKKPIIVTIQNNELNEVKIYEM